MAYAMLGSVIAISFIMALIVRFLLALHLALNTAHAQTQLAIALLVGEVPRVMSLIASPNAASMVHVVLECAIVSLGTLISNVHLEFVLETLLALEPVTACVIPTWVPVNVFQDTLAQIVPKLLRFALLNAKIEVNVVPMASAIVLQAGKAKIAVF
jgi:hypothetical protein